MNRSQDEKILFDIFFHGDKTAYINQIRQAIPLIQKLDPSFWEVGNFLRWQLIRLNKIYQRDVYNIWQKAWACSNPHKFEETKKYFLAFGDYFPHPKANFMDWMEEQSCPKENAEYSYSLDGDIEAILKHIKISNKKTEEELRGYLTERDFDSDPLELILMRPPHIPWVFRFPSITSLNEIPSFPKRRGVCPDWGRNLLIYEMSQAGVSNMGIARELFGIKKSTEKWPDKHPVLVQISNTKKAIQDIVSKAYPLSLISQ